MILGFFGTGFLDSLELDSWIIRNGLRISLKLKSKRCGDFTVREAAVPSAGLRAVSFVLTLRYAA